MAYLTRSEIDELAQWARRRIRIARFAGFCAGACTAIWGRLLVDWLARQ